MLISVTASVGGFDEQNANEIRRGLHHPLKRAVPEVAVQGFGLFLLGENKHVLFTLVNLIKRASGVAVWLCHKSYADMLILAISAGRNSNSV